MKNRQAEEMITKVQIWDRVTLLSNWAIFIGLALTLTNHIETVTHSFGAHLLLIATGTRLLWSIFANDYNHISQLISWPHQLVSHIYLTLTLDTTPHNGHSPMGGLLAFTTLVLGFISGSAYFLGEVGIYVNTLTYMSYAWLFYATSVIYKLFTQQISPFDYLLKGSGNLYVNAPDVYVNKNLGFTLSRSLMTLCVIAFFAITALIPTLSKHDIPFEQAIAFSSTPQISQETFLSEIETAAGNEGEFSLRDRIEAIETNSAEQAGLVNVRTQENSSRSENLNSGFDLPMLIEE